MIGGTEFLAPPILYFGCSKELESSTCFRYSRSMPADISLQEMSLPEKMALLEALWEDLSKSPDWHKDVLEERRQRAQSGEDTFSDWEDAQRDIRKRIS